MIPVTQEGSTTTERMPLAGAVSGERNGTRLTPLRETALVTLLLCVVAALVYGSYITRGGFVTDPWVVKGWFQQTHAHGFLALSEAYIEYNQIGFSRSLDFVRLAAQSIVLGWNMEAWLVWQVAMCVIMSAVLFVLLRRLRFGLPHAAAISALVLIFPAANSIRIWPIMGSPAAITLTILGFLVALRAFEAEGRRRIALHGLSLSLFVVSAFLYEAAFALMFCSVLLYRLRVPWRPALRRWVADVAVLSVVAVLLAQHASLRGHQDLAGMLSHAGTIADQALTLFTTEALPLGDLNRWLVVAPAAAIPAAALVRLRREPAGEHAERLRFWLWTLIAGFIVVVLGYLSFVPADDTYEPLAPGVGNRVNSVPEIGFVLVLYALIMLAAVLLAARASRPARFATAGGIATCAAVALAWLPTIHGEEDAFVAAHREEDRVIRTIRKAVPAPVAGSTIWAFGQAIWTAPGVPIFDQFGSLGARIRLTYGDLSLNGMVGAPGTSFSCGGEAIVPHGPTYPETGGPASPNASAYGQTYFVDTQSGRGELVHDPRQCLKAAAQLPSSPYLISEAAPEAPSPDGGLPGEQDVGAGRESLGAPVRPGAVAGVVDYVAKEGDVIYLSGWATTGDMRGPADRAVAMIDGKPTAEARVIGDRPDVASVYEDQGLAKSGFVLALKPSTLKCRKPAEGLTVFGIASGAATRLPLVGGSEGQLADAC